VTASLYQYCLTVNWLRRLFSFGGGPEEEALERQEYGVPDPDEVARAERSFGSFYAGAEASEAAEEELDELKPPADPAP
jgi:hypothetical protein